ncbi:MAG: methyltransferase domain-containing protein [Bacteroidetes bacterium]|jgi:tRNA A58 N-methylase Trm61|nr:methyltransferase domain-containing protein [Bacteroidota bacterium]
MYSVLDFVHHLTMRALDTGGVAVDATVGNGHDALHLARAVGTDGRVYGFDTQPQALKRTRQRLATAGVAERVLLHEASHATMVNTLPAEVHSQVGAVMFTLGYLPGGDHAIITTPDTTIQALQPALTFLRAGGVVTVVLYVGHPGGAAEAHAVTEWAATLDQEAVQVLSYPFINQVNAPPALLALHAQLA